MRMEITNINAVFGAVLAQGGRSEVFAGLTHCPHSTHRQERRIQLGVSPRSSGCHLPMAVRGDPWHQPTFFTASKQGVDPCGLLSLSTPSPRRQMPPGLLSPMGMIQQDSPHGSCHLPLNPAQGIPCSHWSPRLRGSTERQRVLLAPQWGLSHGGSSAGIWMRPGPAPTCLAAGPSGFLCGLWKAPMEPPRRAGEGGEKSHGHARPVEMGDGDHVSYFPLLGRLRG